MSLSDNKSSTDNEILTFAVKESDAGSRVDNFLACQIAGWSRARLQRLIEDEDVLVNGKTVKSSYKLHANDELEVELAAAPSALSCLWSPRIRSDALRE